MGCFIYVGVVLQDLHMSNGGGKKGGNKTSFYVASEKHFSNGASCLSIRLCVLWGGVVLTGSHVDVPCSHLLFLHLSAESE